MWVLGLVFGSGDGEEAFWWVGLVGFCIYKRLFIDDSLHDRSNVRVYFGFRLAIVLYLYLISVFFNIAR